MNLQREKGEEQADQSDQNNSLSLKGGKKGKFSKSKKENIRGRQPDLEYEEEREKERMKRRQRRRLFAFTATSDFDLLRKGDSWIFPNSPAASALRRRHRRKCQSLSISLGKMMPRLPQQLTDEIKTKSALEPSFPHPLLLSPLIVFWRRQRKFILRNC